MKVTAIPGFVLGALTTCIAATRLSADDPESRPPALQAMSWNIRYDNPRDGVNAWKHRADWVAEIINKNHVDIAGLQEVLQRQLNDLKRRLPDMHAYGVGRDDGKAGGEFAPVLYRRKRFELLDKSTFWLSRTPRQPGSRDWDAAITRIASWVKLKDRRTGSILYVINTHFDHRGKVARTRSAALLVKQLGRRFADHPVILTGDFNTTPNTLPYKTLTAASDTNTAVYRDAYTRSARKPEGPRSTWNGFRAIVPNRRIDYVFVTDTVKVLRHRILDDRRNGRFPSDHLPVLTTVQVPKPANSPGR